MNTVDDGPSGAPRSAVCPDRTGRHGRRPDAVMASVLALANFAAITLMTLHLVAQFERDHDDVGRNVNFFLGSDLAAPLIEWVWFLILLNGFILCIKERARVVGIALVMTAVVIAVPVVAWVIWTLMTFSYG